MKGIYLINERYSLKGLPLTDSINKQKESLIKYVAAHGIKVVKLNLYQIHPYYTIPHALLFDLKQKATRFDCLLIYSLEAMNDFIYMYPAKWLILKSYFNEIIIVEETIEKAV